MNNDLISRSALLSDIEDTVVVSARNTKSAEMRGIHKVTNRIKAAPTVDAVEVVRCTECEYYENEECVNPYIFTSDGAHLYTKPQDFCSYGERRTDA